MFSATSSDDSEEFSKKVILVHPLQSNSILDFIYKTNRDELAAFDVHSGAPDVFLTAVNAIAKDNTLLSDDALIGSHLDFSTNQYHDSFIDRPHMHWWWNGLFQANSGGDWEQSFFAYLEPLNEFDNVMGCAPYDTMTMGPHKLGSESCILVPLACASLLRERLKSYTGHIVTYNHTETTLRDAINKTLKDRYPQAFKLLNKKGQDINSIAMSDGDKNFDLALCQESDYNQYTGYYNSLYIGSTDTPLMSGEGQIQFPAFRAYARGRFVGLHSSSPTDVESHRLTNVLKIVSAHPERIDQYRRHFVCHPENSNLNDLCLLEAFNRYKKLGLYATNSGAHDYARYILIKAFMAEFRLIADQHDKRVNLKPAELRLIIENNLITMIDPLEALSRAAQQPNDGGMQSYKKSMLSEYSETLKNIYKAHNSILTVNPPVVENARELSRGPNLLSADNAHVEQKGERINPDSTIINSTTLFAQDSHGLFPPVKPSEYFLPLSAASNSNQAEISQDLEELAYRKLPEKISLLIAESKTNPPKSQKDLLVLCDNITQLIQSANKSSLPAFLFKAKAFEWVFELLLTYQKKHGPDNEIMQRSTTVVKELLVNIKTALALIFEHTQHTETVNLNPEMLQSMLTRKFDNYMNYYFSKMGYTLAADKNAGYESIKKASDLILSAAINSTPDDAFPSNRKTKNN